MGDTEKRDFVKLAAQFDQIFLFIENHKRQIVIEFFGSATQDYVDGWFRRDTATFWCDLDLPHRRRLVKLALEYYEDDAGRAIRDEG